MPTADLGWCIARCRIDATPGQSELLLYSPASDGEDAQELAIVGLEGILALRDLLDDSIKQAEQAADLSNGKLNVHALTPADK